MREDIDREALKKMLLQRRAEILASSAGQAGESAPRELDQTRVGRLSRVDALQQQAMSQAAARRNAEELSRIERALERIDSENFGYCVVCEDEIAVKRLNFDPSIPTCIDCARASEQA